MINNCEMNKKSIYKTEEGKIQILNFYNSVLNFWPQPNERLNISTKYGNTYVIVSGDKNLPALILLHGSSTNSAMWLGDIEKLSKTHCLYSIDIIGECGNSDESRPKFENNNYSDWIHEILEYLNIKSVAFVANSLGGWIALDYTIKHPEKVDKLVLLATAGITNIKFSTLIWIMILSMFRDFGVKKVNKMVYGNLAIDKTALEFASLVKEYYMPRTDVLPVFSDEQLNKINCKTLFVGGDNDCFYNSDLTAQRLKVNVKFSECVILQNTGHVLVGLSDRISNFLNDLK